jgi:plasmid maintenance system antidote protein VapI
MAGQLTLQELMACKNVTQREMVKELGLSEGHVSLMVSGKRRMTMDYAAVFAKKLNVTIDDIFLAVNFAKRKVIHREAI